MQHSNVSYNKTLHDKFHQQLVQTTNKIHVMTSPQSYIEENKWFIIGTSNFQIHGCLIGATLKRIIRHETARPFDIGFNTEEIKPIIDLDPLAGSKKSKKSDGPSDDMLSDSGYDAYSILMLPSSKDMSNVVSSAFGALRLLSDDLGDLVSLDKKLAKRWLGHMLQPGQIFELHGIFLLSLGFHGFAALMMRISRLRLSDGTYIFSLWDSFPALVCFLMDWTIDFEMNNSSS